MKILVACISLESGDNNKTLHINKKNYLVIINNNKIVIQDSINIKNIFSIKNPIFLKKTNKEYIFSSKRNEKIYKLHIHNIINELDTQHSLNNGEVFTKNFSEKDIQKHIIKNYNEYFPNVEFIKEEYKTPYGNIDVLGIDDNNIYYILEIKKRSTDFRTIDQVISYSKYFEELGYTTKLFVCGVNNNNKNKLYAKNNNVNIINIKEGKKIK